MEKSYAIVLDSPETAGPEVYRLIGSKCPLDWLIVPLSSLPAGAVKHSGLSKPERPYAVYSYYDLQKDIAAKDKLITSLKAELDDLKSQALEQEERLRAVEDERMRLTEEASRVP